MKRALTTRNLFDKKTGHSIRLCSPVLAEAIGRAERKGLWLIYGMEKHGKTSLALQLARDISQTEKVAYISAEEGTDESFRNAARRAGITAADRVLWEEYLTVDEIVEKYSRPRTATVIFLDNLTVYKDELKSIGVRELENRLPGKLLVCVAHEDRREPSPASAKMAAKMAKVVIHVRGLKATVISRFARGGEVVIDEEKSSIFWGDAEK